MATTELADRLATATAGIESLRADVVAREPWPLSEAYGTEPESNWGPKEVLAHVAEMLGYWLAQVEAIVASPAGGEPPSFGRVATDPDRIARIGADRDLPAGELFDRIDAASADVQRRLAELSTDELARSGVHPRLGEMTVPAIFERFIVSHLEEHVRQLSEVLDRG
jgi:hypothetical protein